VKRNRAPFQNEFHDNHKREITFAWLQIAFIFQKLNLIRVQVGLAFRCFKYKQSEEVVDKSLGMVRGEIVCAL
jgi:peptide-methionine (R)-S-oxide reductase